MKARLRKYDPERDFLRIRDFFVETYQMSGRLINWRIERWNYARYFVAPLLGAHGAEHPNVEGSKQAIRFWEDTVGVWENGAGEIAGVVNIEHPATWHLEFGQVFLQRHPKYEFLLEEMLDYAEENLANEEKNQIVIFVYDYDRTFQELLRQRGYQKDAEHPWHDSEFVIEGELPEQTLPTGYAIRSMADENDVERRRKIFGLGFNHPDPKEWPTAFAYEELQRAPDYRKELDLYVAEPDGEYAACCIAWYDGLNRMGILEPVATHPDFRCRGFGRAVVMEGVRRVAALGAETVQVGSGQAFYEAIGFKKKFLGYCWIKEFLE